MATRPRLVPIRRPGPGDRAPVYYRQTPAADRPPVAVLGAGPEGAGLAAYLAAHGLPVVLHDPVPARLEPFARQGGIRVRLPDGEDTLLRPVLCTGDPGAAAAGARVIMAALPHGRAWDLARDLVPHLAPGQTLLLLPTGGSGGPAAPPVPAPGPAGGALYGYTAGFPFAVDLGAPGEVAIRRVRLVRAAAVPAWRTPELLSVCRPLLPMLSGTGPAPGCGREPGAAGAGQAGG